MAAKKKAPTKRAAKKIAAKAVRLPTPLSAARLLSELTGFSRAAILKDVRIANDALRRAKHVYQRQEKPVPPKLNRAGLALVDHFATVKV